MVKKLLSKNFARPLSAGILTLMLAGPVMSQEETWNVQFRDADIKQVIQWVGDVTDKTMVIDPRVNGRVEIISKEPLNRVQVYNLFLAVLDIHGFTAVDVGDIVRIIPVKNARTTPTQFLEANEKTEEAQVTRVIKLENIDASKLIPVIRPLAPQHAHVAAYGPANAIIITDTPQNIERLQLIVDHIDRPFSTELVQLQYAQADKMVEVLTKLRASGNAGGGGDTAEVKIIADSRSNGVLVSGDDGQRAAIRELIGRLDKPGQKGGEIQVVYLEYARAEKMAKVLQNVLQSMSKLKGNESATSDKASVEADEDTNSLLITADLETQQSLMTVIDQLDIRRAQVLVEAIIVDISDISGKELGVQWLFVDGDNGFGSSINSGREDLITGSASALLDEDGDSSDLVSALGSTAGQVLGVAGSSGTDFLAIINALQDESGANILSTPNILTMDNNEATITVGQEVPFVTGSYTSTGDSSSVSNPFQTIERENVGITLKVTPHVNEGDSIVLEIEQEVSSLSNSASVDASDIITNERKITTQILAKDGATVVLGGLMSDEVQTYEQRVPLLGSIPVLGHLFRSESSGVTKTNLMVFLRASVIRDDEKLAGATGEKYKYIREQQSAKYDTDAITIRGKEFPILPEWKETVSNPSGAPVGGSPSPYTPKETEDGTDEE